VHDVATRWGFWNLGEFAADYRRQFGELPSETLRRTRVGMYPTAITFSAAPRPLEV
jgi:AraC-like DNA-binding protein